MAVGLLFFLLLVGAGVVTAVHSIVLSAERLGAPPEATALLRPALSGLIVGLLYIGGAAAWDDPLQFAIGAWISVTTGAGCLLGPPGLYLVMCLVGGGGFLAMAAWFTVRRQSRSQPAPA